jgi:hypothetical protein
VLLVRIAVLALASMFWPLLLIVVVMALQSSRPAHILVFFYAGGFLTATAVGAAMVFLLQGSPLMTGSRLPSGPWFDVGLGALAIAGAVVLRRAYLHRRARAQTGGAKRSSRSKRALQRLVEGGGRLAFAGGVVGSCIPGPLVVLAMADIAQLGYSTFATLIVIVLFFVIVFTFIEVPIGGFMLAPEPTRAISLNAKAWLDRNTLRLAYWALAIGGAIQVVRGLIAGLL